MKVKLTRDTIVRLNGGTVLDVPDEEAKRLAAFGNAEIVEEKKKTKGKGGK